MARKKKLPPLICKGCGEKYEPNGTVEQAQCACPIYVPVPRLKGNRFGNNLCELRLNGGVLLLEGLRWGIGPGRDFGECVS